MKHLIKFTTTCLSLLICSVALATPSLFDLVGISGPGDTGKEAVQLTDTGVLPDTSVSTLLFREHDPDPFIRGFGIYGFSVDAGTGDVSVGDTLDVFVDAGSMDRFAGVFGSPTSAKLSFDLIGGTVKNLVTGETANIGPVFGFYLDVVFDDDGSGFERPESGEDVSDVTRANPVSGDDSLVRLFSHHMLNPNGADDVLLFDTSLDGSIPGDVLVAFETDGQVGGRTQDFDDLIIGVSDVTPVPEPDALFLMGLGILGLGLLRRRSTAA